MLQRGMTTLETVAHLSDSELLDAVKAAAQSERDVTARLVALLAHVDERRLYLGEGCSSLFTCCTQVIHLSEHAAYGRIEAARAARRYPIVLDLLADGSVTLTTVILLAPLLTPANHRALLDEARHQSKRDVEHIVARLRPQPPVAATVRKLPAPTPPVAVTAPVLTVSETRDELPVLSAPPPSPPRATVTPLAPERYKVQFTVSRDTHDKLRRVQDLLRHAIPNGDPAAIFDRALTVLLADLERLRPAPSAKARGVSERGWGPASRQKSRPSVTACPQPARRAPSGSRHIPAAVKREVWTRDGGRCAFVGASGRCTERGFLEFHHVRPYADGGATEVENLELRCRAHNMYEAEQYFGSRLPLLVREAGAAYVMTTRSRPSPAG
jgi:HNH endonuclease